MLKNTVRSLLIFSAAAFFLAAPSVHAGPVGDALKQSVKSSSFHYEADTTMSMGKGGDLDLPFKLEANVKEEGGKTNNIYAQSATVKVSVKSMEDLPKELSDLSFVDMMATFSASYDDVTTTSYFLIDEVNLSTDSKSFSEILQMFEEFSKFFTGKSFKITKKDLLNSFKDVIGGSLSSSEEEMILSLLAKSQTLPEITDSFADFLDVLIDSGVIAMKTTSSNAGTMYSLSPGSKVKAEKMKGLVDGLADFADSLAAGSGIMMKNQANEGEYERLAADLNGLLGYLSESTITIDFLVSNSRISSMTMDLEFSPLGFPLSVESKTSFDYSGGYSVPIPTNEMDIININEIVDGVVAIAEMANDPFQQTRYENSSYGGEDSYFLYYGVPLSMEIGTIYSDCDLDITCIRKGGRKLLTQIRKLKTEGLMSNEEYRQAIRSIRLRMR